VRLLFSKEFWSIHISKELFLFAAGDARRSVNKTEGDD